jgi:hypothetical protein
MQAAGNVQANGDPFGSFTLRVSRCTPVVGVPAVDLTDPARPERVLRLTTTGEVRIAGPGAEATRADRELVLDPGRCSTLNSILQIIDGEASGSVRFDCNLGGEGRVRGMAQFDYCGGNYSEHFRVAGRVAMPARTVGVSAFAPNRCTVDGGTVSFWDVTDPRVLLEVTRVPSDATIIKHGGSNARARVVSTAVDRAPLSISAEQCRTITLASGIGASLRVNSARQFFYEGTVQIDCSLSGGEEFAGVLEFAQCPGAVDFI